MKQTLDVQEESGAGLADEIREAALELIRNIGLPDGFYDGLWHEDDWSFVVKSSALVETALAHTLQLYIAKPEVSEFVERLSFNQKRQLLAAADLLPEYREFIGYLAWLRNHIVHDIRRTSFTFPVFFAEHDAWHKLWCAMPYKDKQSVPPAKVAPTWAKPAIWLGLTGTLASAYAESESIKVDMELQALRVKLLADLMKE